MAQIAVKDICDLCEVEDSVNFFCVNCDEILCSQCKVSHAKSKSSRNHKIILLSQARRENIVHKSTQIYCSQHSTEEITLFCLKCDQLICLQCVAKKHKGHNITIPSDIRDSKSEELCKNIQTLKEKRTEYENALYEEGQIHIQFTKSIEQARKDLFHQKAKIIEELGTVCNQQNDELTKLQQNEDKRYSDTCDEIQNQNQTVTSAIQAAENSMASNNTSLIIQSATDTTSTLDGLGHPPKTNATTAVYRPGDRSCPIIHRVLGKVNIIATDVYKVKEKEQEAGGDNKQQQRYGDNYSRTAVNKARVKFIITAMDTSDIHVIVPLKDGTIWIKASGHKHMSLINNEGKIMTRSILFDALINDAKEYNGRLLVTCRGECEVMNMSANGKSTSTFSNLSPYETNGICVTQDLQVMVCLQSAEYDKENKVVRLNSEGDIIQTIQHDVTGTSLYNDPWRVASLTTGEVIVVDRGEPDRIVGVDREGQQLFTWDGKIQGRKIFDKYSLNCITHDSNNLFVTDYGYNRVYVLKKDGSGAMCLLDKKRGVNSPCGICVNINRLLLIGCRGGKIHTIELL